MNFHPETIAAVNAAKRASEEFTAEGKSALLYKAAAFLLAWAEDLDGVLATEMTPAPEPRESFLRPLQERGTGMSPAYAHMVAAASRTASDAAATPEEATT